MTRDEAKELVQRSLEQVMAPYISGDREANRDAMVREVKDALRELLKDMPHPRFIETDCGIVDLSTVEVKTTETGYSITALVTPWPRVFVFETKIGGEE